MKIPAIMYMVVGIIIAGTSFFLTKISNQAPISKFMLFIIIGAVFFLIGLIKLFLARSHEPPKVEMSNSYYQESQLLDEKDPSIPPQTHHIQTHQTQKHNNPQNIHYAHNYQAPIHRPIHTQAQHHPHPQRVHQANNTHQSSQNNSVKYCRNCGSVLRNFDKFCYKCGSRVFQ